MLRIILFLSIITAAVGQALTFPEFSFSGSPIPLVMISLTLISFRKVDILPWLGLMAGLVIDCTSIGPFGLWSLYYLAICLILRWLLHQPKVRWWWRVAWVGSSLTIAPIYAQLLTGHIYLKYWPEIIVLPAILLSLAVAVPCWLATRGHKV
jgi:cell shape-determining protein MreD